MKTLILLVIGLLLQTSLNAQDEPLQTDSIVENIDTRTNAFEKKNRYVMRSTLYGVGYTNILDTYLSPQEYTGIEVRIVHERMRMTNMLNENVSTQSMLQADIAYTENSSETGNELAGLVNWSYGLHYHFRLHPNFKLLAGALGELNGGFIYNTRNSNNPAQAKAYINLSASVMAIYRFYIKQKPFLLRYQVNAPFLGVMFSPEYQQSYYEIFTLGNHDGIINFTSVHNQPSMRQLLTLDIPINQVVLRLAYVGDFQQSKVNSIRCHTYSHVFLFGFVKNFYLVKRKDKEHAYSPFNP